MLQNFQPDDLPAPPFLAIMAGLPGAGKSTLAPRLAGPGAVLSSDAVRSELADGAPDHRDAWLSLKAFATIHGRASDRLARGLAAVVDSTGLEAAHRSQFAALAAEAAAPLVIVFVDAPPRVAQSRNAARPLDRRVPDAAFERFAEMALGLWEAVVHERPAQAWRLDEWGRVKAFRWFPGPRS